MSKALPWVLNLAGGGSSGSSTDVKINGTSITTEGVADIKTKGVYDANTNKLATENDLPTEFKVYIHDSNEGLNDANPMIVNTLNVGLHIFKYKPRYFKATPSTGTLYIDNDFASNKIYIFKKWSESMTNGEVFGYFDYLSTTNKYCGVGKFVYIDHGNYLVFNNMNYGSTSELIPTNENHFYNYVTFHNYLPTVQSGLTPTNNTHLVPKKYVDDSITAAITTTLGGNY